MNLNAAAPGFAASDRPDERGKERVMADFKLPPNVIADKLLDAANDLQYGLRLPNQNLAALLRQAAGYLRSPAHIVEMRGKG